MLNQHGTTKNLIEKYNRLNPLADFLLPFVGDKKEVTIADIGSGPFSIIGSYLEDVSVRIYHIDNQDFTDFWKKYKATPFITIEKHSMEKLLFPDSSFDIVVCINALDHTHDAFEAVKEMIRVCKPNGWVYIDSCLDQMTTGHKHYWNAKKNGTFSDGDYFFDLKDYGFGIKFIDNGGESRYNHIIATLQK